MKKNMTIAAALLIGAAANAQTATQPDAKTATAQTITQTLSETESILGKRDPRLKVDLDTRIDLQYIEGSNPEYSDFNLQNMRLIVTGEIVSGLRYRWRQRINKPTTTNADGSGSATDHIWVAVDLGHRWTLTAGKQFVQLGTYEFAYNGADVYLSSLVNNDFTNTRIGVNAAYKFLGQTLNFQFMNAGEQMTADDYTTQGLAAAAMWEGSLFDGVIGTRIGYAAFQHNSSEIYQWTTAGLQVNTGVLTTEFDFYHGDRMMDYSSTVAIRTGKHHVRDMSGSANFKFAFGKWRPSVKGIWDRRKDMELNSDAYDNLGIQALLEYYPFAEGLLKDMGFHAMYSYKNTEFEGAFSDMESTGVNTALVGMHWIIPVK